MNTPSLWKPALTAAVVTLGGWLAPTPGLEDKVGLPLAPATAKAVESLDIYTDGVGGMSFQEATYHAIDTWFGENPGSTETDFNININKGESVMFDHYENSEISRTTLGGDYNLTFIGNLTVPGMVTFKSFSGDVSFRGVNFSGVSKDYCIMKEGTATGNYEFRGNVTVDEGGSEYPASTFTAGGISITFDGSGGGNLLIDQYDFNEAQSLNATSIDIKNLVNTATITRSIIRSSEIGIVIGAEAGTSPELYIVNNTLEGFDDAGIEFSEHLVNTTGSVSNNIFSNSPAGTGIKGCENFSGTIDTNNFDGLAKNHEGDPANDYYFDPEYLNPGGENYRISTDSELVDLGIVTALSLPYRGDAPDIGAYETPEPATLGLLAAGMVAALTCRRAGQKKP